MDRFNSPEYKRSRAAYITQCTVEYFVSLLVTDAFLAKLLTYAGISDSLIGIISSFISLAFVMQIMSIFVVRARVSTKKLVIGFDTVSIFFFMLLYIVPFMPLSDLQKTAVIILSILFAYAAKYLIYSICYKWANSFVDPTKRATYSATKEIISLVSGIFFTTITGYVIDRYESLGNIEGAFLFIAISMLILNICNFICLLNIKKESVSEHKADRVPFTDVVKHTLGNRNFRSVIVLTALWDIARYFSIGFMGVFKTNDLLISVFTVQLINMVANVIRIFVSKPFGRYSDKYSYAKGFKLALCVAAGAFFINIFTTNSTWFLIILYTVLYNASVAGTNQNSFNIAYSYVDAAYISQAMAFKNCIGGVLGFGASLMAGVILNAVKANGNCIFGVHIYGQQILSAISFVIAVIAIIYTKKVVEKQKVMIQ